MAKILVAYVRVIGSVSERLWKGTVWIVPCCVGILLYEAFTRYALHSTCIWSTELLEFLIVGGGIISGAYLLRNNEHIRVDIFYYNWSPRRKAIADTATFGLFVYIAVMAINFVQATKISFIIEQASITPWGPPFWPVKAAITFGAILLLLQGTANLIRDIAIIRGKPLA